MVCSHILANSSGDVNLPCYYPNACKRWKVPHSDGKRPLVFRSQYKEFKDAIRNGDLVDFVIPCGQCTGCRLERARQWAMRCTHAASLHDRNCFITLTYDDDHLPADKSISTDEMQRFWKRLRERTKVKNLKYFAAGEYGEKRGRPHYHACVFGFDFSDKKYAYKSQSGEDLYSSELLSSVWGNGRCDIGAVTFESACYVARYTLSKRYGPDAEAYYARLGIEPERAWMSKGIGKEWFEKFQGDCYPKDYLTLRGVQQRPPIYYDRLLTKNDPVLMQEIKDRRERDAKLNISKINLDMRDILVTREVLDVDWKSTKLMSGYIQKPVAEIVHEASMRVGRVDNER